MERDGTKFTAEQRQHMRDVAWAWHLERKTQQEIANQLDVSQATVSYWLAHMKKQHPQKTPAEIIAARIRGEMVCCDLYQRFQDASPEEKKKLSRGSPVWHEMCFYGEWAAQLALRQYP